MDFTDFDATGKVSLDHIYTEPDPRAYFTTLRKLDYQIPALAQPYFEKFIESYRRSQRVEALTVLDIGCSYGINAALLRCGATMEELYERYDAPEAQEWTREQLLASDSELIRTRNAMPGTRFVGLDTSQQALSYALAAGFLDEAVHADLEGSEPTERQTEQLSGVDLVISTGCIGYVTEKTISRIVAANEGRKPWMAHFVLRMFPFEPVAASLSASGYETVRLEPLVKQRRFASRQERTLLLDTLSTVGVDPSGVEADGWLYAQLHISRPRGSTGRVVIDLAALTTDFKDQCEQ